MRHPTSLESIFSAALEKGSAEDRAAFLNQACAGNDDLRLQVERLLSAVPKVGSFLERPFAPTEVEPGVDAGRDARAAATLPPRPISEGPGTRIGPYKLLQKIGEGGMGVVYMAEQEHPIRRRVALKIIKPGMDSALVIARFEAERQALAMMDYLNIARVLDAGTTESGRPYFVMELVHGVPITHYCDENKLSLKERLELFVPVCRAMQHAHQKGIIHRDVKPSNVLVTLYDGKPVPKVIDFGVAKAIEQKLTERTMFTQYGSIVGTLEYMAPEQAEMSGLGVDTRSDIYSLGVLLYELLTGTTPVEQSKVRELTYIQLLRMIQEDEPPKPSTRLSTTQQLATIASQRRTGPRELARLVRGELDWIVMKALEKDRTRRYETAIGLARDVERYLHDEPVEAGPPSARYRLRKYARKYRRGLQVAGAFAFLLVAGAAISAWEAVQARWAQQAAVQERDRAVAAEEAARREQERALAAEAGAIAARGAEAAQRQKAEAAQRAETDLRQQAQSSLKVARRNLYFSQIHLAQQSWLANDLETTDRLLSNCPKEPRGWEWNYLWRMCHGELFLLPGNGQFTTSVHFSRDGKRMAAIATSGDSGARIWDLTTRMPIVDIDSSKTSRSFCAGDLDPGGDILALGDRNDEVTLWSAGTGKLLRVLGTLKGPIKIPALPPDGGIKFLAFAANGKRLVAANQDGIRIWDVETGANRPVPTDALHAAAFSPDGKRLLSFKKNGPLLFRSSIGQELLTLWNLDSLAVEREFGPATSWSFSPDGRLLAIGRWNYPDSQLRVIEIESGRAVLSNGSYLGGDLAFSPDGKLLAVASHLGKPAVDIWDVAGARRLRTIRGHTGLVNGIGFTPDGELVTCSWDQTIKFWDPRTDLEARRLPGKGVVIVSDAAFRPDGKQVAMVQGDNVTTAFGVVGSLFFGNPGDQIIVWDPIAGKTIHKLPGHLSGARRVAYSANGTRLISGGRDGQVKVWETGTGKLLSTFKGHDGWIEAVAIHPNGRLAASSHEPKELLDARIARVIYTKKLPGTVKVWDVSNATEVATLTGHPDTVYRAAFSPDGTTLVTASYKCLRVWAIKNWKLRRNIENDKATGTDGLYFTPDGKLLFAARPGAVGLWDVESGEYHGELACPGDPGFRALAVMPDGSRVATVFGRTVKLWDLRSTQEILTLPVLEPVEKGSFSAGGSRWALQFTADGYQLLATLADGSSQYWEATPLPTAH